MYFNIQILFGSFFMWKYFNFGRAPWLSDFVLFKTMSRPETIAIQVSDFTYVVIIKVN